MTNKYLYVNRIHQTSNKTLNLHDNNNAQNYQEPWKALKFILYSKSKIILKMKSLTLRLFAFVAIFLVIAKGQVITCNFPYHM